MKRTVQQGEIVIFILFFIQLCFSHCPVTTLPTRVMSCEANVTRNIVHNDTSKGTSVDRSDVDHHSGLMEKWWDPFRGPVPLLHTLNQIRVPFVVDGLAYGSWTFGLPLKGLKILDVGCGGGILSEALAGLGAEVTGLDPSEDLIRTAREHSQLNSMLLEKPTYFATTLEEHAETNPCVYDAVVASEVLEHATDPGLFVASCARVLKPGGRVFVTTPNRNELSNYIVIDLLEKQLKIIPEGTHQIEKFVTPAELSGMLEASGCYVEAVKGFTTLGVGYEWFWTDTTDIFYALRAVKC